MELSRTPALGNGRGEEVPHFEYDVSESVSVTRALAMVGLDTLHNSRGPLGHAPRDSPPGLANPWSRDGKQTACRDTRHMVIAPLSRSLSDLSQTWRPNFKRCNLVPCSIRLGKTRQNHAVPPTLYSGGSHIHGGPTPLYESHPRARFR